MAFEDARICNRIISKQSNNLTSSKPGILKTQNLRFQSQSRKQGRGLTNDLPSTLFNLNPTKII